MREYMVYLMKDEVAKKYRDKETKLLLSLVFCSFQSQIAKKQLHYITDHVPNHFNEQIFDGLKENPFYVYNRNIHTIELESGQASLIVSDEILLLTSQGNIKAEQSFLEALRATDTNLFAIEKSTFVYSWLIRKSALQLSGVKQ